MTPTRPRQSHAARVLVFGLLLSLLIPIVGAGSGGTTPARADNISSQIASARQRQQQLQRSIQNQKNLLNQLNADESVARTALSSTSDQLGQINTDQASVQQQVQDATDALHRVQAREQSLVDQLRQLDWTLSLIDSQIEQGTEDLQAQQRALGQRLADAYRTQQTGLLEQILSANSFTDVITQTSAYLSFGDKDAQMAQAIAQDQASLDSLRQVSAATRLQTDQLRRDAVAVQQQLEAQQAQLAAAQRRLAALEAKTQRIRDQQVAAFNRINNNQAKANAAIAAQAKAQARLTAKVAALIAEAQRRAAAAAAAKRARQRDTGPGGSSGNGMFMWPTTGVVTQEFGCTGFVLEPPYGNCSHFHQGIDIANGSGTPVHAAADGVVAFVGYNPYEGSNAAFMVIIGHAGGFDTWYVHLLPRYVIHQGQSVQRGQVIGYMGNTGHSTGTHLHWQVMHNGVPVNPRNYV